MEFVYFLIRRVLWSLLVLIGLSITIFLIARVMPGDPARMALGPRASQEQVEDLKVKMGLNLPLDGAIRAVRGWAAHGDLGLSFLTKRPVNDDIRETFAATLELVLVTIVIAFVVGVPLGVLAAANKDGWIDNLGAAVDHIRRGHAELPAGASSAGARRLRAAYPADHGTHHAGFAGDRQYHRLASRGHALERRSRRLLGRAEAPLPASDRAVRGRRPARSPASRAPR